MCEKCFLSLVSLFSLILIFSLQTVFVRCLKFLLEFYSLNLKVDIAKQCINKS